MIPKRMNRRIKILFLAANPIDSDRLRLDEEIRQIDQALRRSEFRDRFEIRQHWAVRVSELQNIVLRHKPDIVHFSGHGSEASEIYLEDEQGESYAVPGQALGELFRVLQENIKCVVLNACFSQLQARAIAKAVDCVIGMSQAIGDVSSIRFAAAFYQALAFGKDVKTAFELGKNQIDLEKLPDSETPRLFNPKRNAKKITFVDVTMPQESTAPETEPVLATKRFPISRRVFLPAVAGAVLLLLASSLFITDKLSKNKTHANGAPRIVLSGRVRNASRQPIAGATITVVSTHFRAQSRDDGSFVMDLEGKREGDLVNVVVSCDGFKTLYLDHRITGDNAPLNIILQREHQ